MKISKPLALSAPAMVFALALTTTSPASAAEPHCEKTDPAAWKPKEEVVAMLEKEGYTVKKVKVENGCFEAYVIKDGKKRELFFNPVTLEQVGGDDED